MSQLFSPLYCSKEKRERERERELFFTNFHPLVVSFCGGSWVVAAHYILSSIVETELCTIIIFLEIFMRHIKMPGDTIGYVI